MRWLSGVRWARSGNPPQQVLAGTLGFSSGALVTALSFDLFEEAFQTAGGFLAGGGLLAGAVVFVLADITLQRTTDSSSGFALLAGVRTGLLAVWSQESKRIAGDQFIRHLAGKRI